MELGDVKLSGDIAFESVSFPRWEGVVMKLLAVTNAHNVESHLHAGVVGLAPTSSSDGEHILNVLYKFRYIEYRNWIIQMVNDYRDSILAFGISPPQKDFDFVPVKPLPGDSKVKFWSSQLSRVEYRGLAFKLNTTTAIWDSGTPITYFNKGDLQVIIESIVASMAKDEYTLKYEPKVYYNLIEKQGTQFGTYSVECHSIGQFSKLVFYLGDFTTESERQTIELEKEQFIEFDHHRKLCNITFGELADPDAKYAVFGMNMFIKKTILFDMEELRIGIYNPTDVPPTPSSFDVGYIILIIAAVCCACCCITFILFKPVRRGNWITTTTYTTKKGEFVDAKTKVSKRYVLKFRYGKNGAGW